jgi:hypothetical protein
MNAISRLRFDALAGYSRTPLTALIVKELAWYEQAGEKVLGLVVLDRSDRDFASYVLGRDRNGRYRAVWMKCSIETQNTATALLASKMAELSLSPTEEFYQDDEDGTPLDLFTPTVPANRQRPQFVTLASDRGYSPARGLIGEMMHYFEDMDGNFVQQFQSDGFDARIWELYLYAALHEIGYGFDRQYSAPDFHCQGPLGDFFVEATTVNPSSEVPEVDETNQQAYFENYVPIKYGSALVSKLRKRYWDQPHVAGYPLVFAIQDFHARHAMTWSNSALVEYLYAIRQVERIDDEGKSEIVSEKIEEFNWGDKAPVPAGFFFLVGSENISAVIANPSGTLLKFNRIGFLAGFGDHDIKMIRSGYCYKDSLTPSQFCTEVHSPGYTETWCEGLSVYHNPNALLPLPQTAFPGAAHHTSRNGSILAYQPTFHPVGSTTAIIVGT